MTTTRRLAAILAADVVGYSRLMGTDEEGTLTRLVALRQALIEPAVGKSGGRIVKTTGDGFLIEFPSAVEAVRCALDIQAQTREHEKEHLPEQRFQFRIGINVGDVIASDDDIHGDGVNVAARLEALAEPGGILVSANAQAMAVGRLKCTFEDVGEQRLKNISQPVRAFRVTSVMEVAAERPALPLPDKPSIAVLPFANMSGDPEQEYFADGMVEEIITGLSRVRSFFVIARNSSFAYKGKSPDVRQVGRELGVRYVLEGSVRKAGNRVRITGQLIDATTGAHLWADRFDGALEDIFDLQDRVSTSVVTAIEPTIRSAEIRSAQGKPTESLNAYDLYLRALPHLYVFSHDDYQEAAHLLRKAIDIDPNYALACVNLAFCEWIPWQQGWILPTRTSSSEVMTLVRVALKHGGGDPEVLALAAHLTAHAGGDVHAGLVLAEKALALNPNSSLALLVGGQLQAYRGDTQMALNYLERSARVDPFGNGSRLNHAFSVAYFVAGHYETVLEFTEKALRDNPNGSSTLHLRAASLGLLDRVEEGRRVVQHLLTVASSSVSRVRQRYEVEMNNVLKVPGVLDALCEGLRRAGLPE